MQKKQFTKRRAGVITACIASVTSVSAQQRVPVDTLTSRQLPEVEVAAPSRVSVTKQSAPLQVLDGKDIKRLGIQDLSEAVRLFSGVAVKDYGGAGGLKTVSIRSLGAHHTAVGYDGISVSDARSGQVDISRFTLDNVEMVSLSTGQDDDIFRTARMYASAGALNIRTQRPRFSDDKSSLLAVKIKGGSFGLLNPFLSYGRKLNGRWSATACADYMRADGNYPYTLVNGTVKTREKRINSDIATVRLEGNLYGGFGRKGGTLEAKWYTFHSERGLPGSVNFYNKTATERLRNDDSFVQTLYRNPLSSRVRLQAAAKYAYTFLRYRDINDRYAAGFQEDRNTQHEYYTSAGVLYMPSGGLSASLTADYIYTRLNNNFIHAARPRRNTSLTVLAVQYKYSSLTVTGSLLGTYMSDKTENGDRPADRKRLSPAVAFSWQPFKRNVLRIRSSYKAVFRAPTFTDLYYLRMGNTGLIPEKARQYNAGLTWSGSIGEIIRYLSLSVDGYYNRVEDKIVALPTLYIWRMMNMGEVEIKGSDVNVSAELSLSGTITLLLSGSYTYQYAIDITRPEAKNFKHQIPYTPRHTGNGSAAVETPRVTVACLLTAVGERYALPQNTKENRVDAYTELSFSLSRTFDLKTGSLRLQGEIINPADMSYDIIQYYPMPGRSWRLSVTLHI
jgi:outer membrane cobalamin receptor